MWTPRHWTSTHPGVNLNQEEGGKHAGGGEVLTVKPYNFMPGSARCHRDLKTSATDIGCLFKASRSCRYEPMRKAQAPAHHRDIYT